MKLDIFSDGAYSPSRNTGGIGLVFVVNNKVIYKFNKQFIDTTNNRCELSAIIYALHAISKPFDSINIYTDSQYVLGCINENWERKKNQVLWHIFDRKLEEVKELCPKIEFTWIQGHTNKSDYLSRMNDLADKLAVEASQYYEIKKISE